MSNFTQRGQKLWQQFHWCHFSTRKSYKICPILTTRTKVLAFWSFWKPNLADFFYPETRTKPRDCGLFFSNNFIYLIFLPENHIKCVQFRTTRPNVMTVCSFAKTRFCSFLYPATKTKPKDSVIFFYQQFHIYYFSTPKSDKHVQFWQLGQKLWQFQILLNQISSVFFFILQLGPNQETLVFFSKKFIYLIYLPQNHLKYVQFRTTKAKVMAI